MSAGKLLLMSTVALFSGLAAIGFGILLGTIAKTHEQSAPFGATMVVILAALGGVWVPVFIMPLFMQYISRISPMNWGLNAFYDVLLRNGGLSQILPEIILLLLFFLITTTIAILYDNLKSFSIIQIVNPFFDSDENTTEAKVVEMTEEEYIENNKQ